jgi:hypothetical protein
MPFTSKKQARAAFGGFLGGKMKKKAKQWAKETPSMKKLPESAVMDAMKKKVAGKKKKVVKK